MSNPAIQSLAFNDTCLDYVDNVAELAARSLAPDSKKLLRSSHDNFNSLIGYEQRLFEHVSRLVVVRVDLGYNKSQVPNLNHVTAEEFLEHRRRLLVAIQRHKTFEHLVGYATKAEFGIEKGLHCHCLFFFDGSVIREDISAGEMIGWLWANEITQCQGVYYNCNRNPDYLHNGLGIVNYYDKEKRSGLIYAMRYMTKPDDTVRNLLGNARIFTKGIKHAEASSSRMGRPRSK